MTPDVFSRSFLWWWFFFGVAKDLNWSLLYSIGPPLGPNRPQPHYSPVGCETFKEVWQPRFLRVSPSSGQMRKTPRARPPGHDATGSTRHTGKTQIFTSDPSAVTEGMKPSQGGLSLHKHKHAKSPRAPPHARPFPYRPLLSAHWGYHPSPLGRTGYTQTWPAHCLGMPPRQPGQCLADRYIAPLLRRTLVPECLSAPAAEFVRHWSSDRSTAR